VGRVVDPNVLPFKFPLVIRILLQPLREHGKLIILSFISGNEHQLLFKQKEFIHVIEERAELVAIGKVMVKKCDYQIQKRDGRKGNNLK